MTSRGARLAGAWARFWFEPAAPTNLGIIRVLFFAGMLAFYWSTDFSGWGDVANVFWFPLPLFAVLHLPVLSREHLALAQAFWKLLLLLAALGVCTRITTAGAAVLGTYLLGLPHNFGKLHHFDAILVIGMGVLALGRCGDAGSLDAWRRRATDRVPLSGEYRWPVQAMWLALAMIYVTAGTAKLWTSGWTWIVSDNMRLRLISANYHIASTDPVTNWGLALAPVPLLPEILGALAVLIELAYPLTLVSPASRVVLVPAAILMHGGIQVLIGPPFVGQYLIANVFWVPWDRLLARRRGRSTPASPPSRAV